MKFIYKARGKDGQIQTGTVEASSREAAADVLRKYDVFVTSLKEEGSFFSNLKNIKFFRRGVSKKDLAIFSRQMAVMLESRVPVTQSLTGLVPQIKKEMFKDTILNVAKMVEEGSSLSDSFAAFPNVFNAFFTSLIKSGEASGKISESLYFLSDHLEREHDIESQVRSAMIYPAFVISVLFVVILIVIFGVMPRLVDLMKETTAEPPAFTKMMISFYGFLAGYGWIVILAFFAFIAFIVFYARTEKGKKHYDIISLKFPLIGDLFRKIYLIRFAESVSTLLSSGVSINNALKITKDTINNHVYKRVVQEAETSVSEGEKISSALIKHKDLVPPFVIQMVKVGEDTGKLDKNLMEIVNFYQKEVKRTIDTLTALLEPILIIFLGVFVALLAASVLAPLYGALGTI